MGTFGNRCADRLERPHAHAGKPRREIWRAKLDVAHVVVIGAGVPAEDATSSREGVAPEQRRRVVQHDEIDHAPELPLDGSCEPDAGVETIRRSRVRTPGEQHREIDVALSMGATLGDTSEQIDGDDLGGGRLGQDASQDRLQSGV